MTLCTKCKANLEGLTESLEPGEFRHHEHEIDFWAAANAGCHFCLSLMRSILRDTPSLVHEWNKILSSGAPANDRVELERPAYSFIRFGIYDEEYDLGDGLQRKTAWLSHAGVKRAQATAWGRDAQGSLNRGVSFSCVAADDVLEHGVHPLYGRISDDARSCSDSRQLVNTGNDHVLDLARRWISQCRQHAACNVSAGDSAFLPTRLVDVKIPDLPSLCRVVSTANDRVCAPYCTLSHCWGGYVPVRLVEQTQEELYHGYSISDLPRTFRDAMMTCRALDVRYIWIDSLCIIQDDEDDWFREAKVMGKVYEYGVCNIAASSAKNATEGLFRDRDPLLIAPTVYTLPPTTHLGLAPGSYAFIDSLELGGRREYETQLNRRAWVFQERILSTRVLHFMEDRLTWECRSMTATETFPDGVAQSLSRNFEGHIKPLEVLRRSQMYLNNDISEHEHCSFPCEFCLQWNKLISYYTGNALTVSDDRPLAIAGVAERVEKMSGNRYLAGLWTNHLPRMLFWSVNKEEAAETMSSKRIYPTFSWLSVDARVSWTGVHHDPSIELIACDLAPPRVQKDRVTTQNGRLTLCGLLRSIRLIPSQRRGERWSITRPLTGGRSDFVSIVGFGGRVAADYTTQDLPTQTIGHEHFLLQSADWYNDPWLILEVVDADPAVYRRIGIVVYEGSSSHNQEDKKRYAEWTRAQEVDETAPGSRCNDGRVVFHLI